MCVCACCTGVLCACQPFGSDKTGVAEIGLNEVEEFISDLIKGNPKQFELLLVDTYVYEAPVCACLCVRARVYMCLLVCPCARVRHSVAIYDQQRMCMREKAWRMLWSQKQF